MPKSSLASSGPSRPLTSRLADNLAGVGEGLLDYVVRTTPHFERPEHLAPLAELLDRSLREPVRAVVSVPPQHGKSQLLLHHLVRLAATRPQLQSGYVSYGLEFARDQAGLAEIIERGAAPRVAFERQTAGSWATSAGGGVYWTGIGGALTGRKVDGILIVDDPYKNRAEAESAGHQRRVLEWWQSVALPRVNPGGSVVVVQARWVDSDLAGQLESDGWRAINLPAIGEDPDPKRPYPQGGTPALGPHFGSALWPSQRPLAWLEEQRELVGEYDWSSLYLGRPQPRGDRLMRGVYSYRDPPGVPPVAGIDLAYTTNSRNDRSVAVCAEIHEGVIYLTNAVLGHFEVEEFADRLGGLEAGRFLFEPGPAEATLVRLLNDRLARKGGPKDGLFGSGSGPVSRITVTQTRTRDKFTSSQPLLQLWNRGRVRVPEPTSPSCGPWVDEVVRECLGFTGSGAERDDVVDALIPLARWVLAPRLFRPEDIERAFSEEVEEWDL